MKLLFAGTLAALTLSVAVPPAMAQRVIIGPGGVGVGIGGGYGYGRDEYREGGRFREGYRRRPAFEGRSAYEGGGRRGEFRR